VNLIRALHIATEISLVGYYNIFVPFDDVSLTT